jgi:hypothetical protein
MEIPVRAMRAVIDPSVSFTRRQFDTLIENQVIEESAIRETAGVRPMTPDEIGALRDFVAFRICAEITPAGNA